MAESEVTPSHAAAKRSAAICSAPPPPPPLSQKPKRPQLSPTPSTSSPAPLAAASASVNGLSSQLSAARFRWLNEKLYTSSSDDAFAFFALHPKEFTAYHVGFRAQVDKWPQHPLTLITSYLSSLSPSTVADMGCGDALIASTFHPHHHTVHSFDLQATSPLITACNIAHTPLPSSSVDIAVFCLSLMGHDWAAFVREGWRVLRLGGELLVAEVASRMREGGGVEGFVKALEGAGFKRKKLVHNDYFVCAWLTKAHTTQGAGKGSAKRKKKAKQGDTTRAGAVQPEQFVLAPCLYKKR